MRNLTYAEDTSSRIWDMTEHMVAVGTAAEHSGLSSIFESIVTSMNASQWCKLHQAINNNDNRLHLIEVFSEVLL